MLVLFGASVFLRRTLSDIDDIVGLAREVRMAGRSSMVCMGEYETDKSSGCSISILRTRLVIEVEYAMR